MNGTSRSISSLRVLILQNCREEGIGLYGTRLRELNISHDTIHTYADKSLPPLDRYGAIIIGGTPLSVNNIHRHNFLLKEGRFLIMALDRGKSILGICFGAQLLARLLGAEVKKNPLMEIGAYPVRLTAAGRSDPLFNGFPRTFPVFHWHGDTFAIPPGAKRLAMDRDCPNQAFRMGSALGLQFHLEITAAEAGSWADTYAEELPAVAKSKAQVIGECREHEPMMANLAVLLLDNFLAAAAMKKKNRILKGHGNTGDSAALDFRIVK
jgi:GMP synthase-like glutamine amidotransferase